MVGSLTSRAVGPRGGVRPATENPGPMVVLGIDPGLANCGFGVVVRRSHRLVATDGGVIATAAGLAPERRLADAPRASGDLLDEHRPDAVALEALYFGQNVRTAFAVGQARGVVLLAAGQRGHRLRRLHPAAGQGRGLRHRPRRQGPGGADGPDAAVAARSSPRPDHAADALAVAICHANHAPFAAAAAVAG